MGDNFRKRGREGCRQAKKHRKRRKVTDQYITGCTGSLSYASSVQLNSCLLYLFCVQSDRYTSKLQAEDKRVLSQATVSSNEMKPNADCIPQHWRREIGCNGTAASQLSVPSKGMKNRCHLKCPGMRAVY